MPETACNLITVYEMEQPIYNYCAPVHYTIIHNEFSYIAHWCELFLTIKDHIVITGSHYNIFYVNLLSCPPGFVQQNGTCSCDPLLNSKLLSITYCDINHQTVLRPANTWLSAITINDSYQYHFSIHCPLHYHHT